MRREAREAFLDTSFLLPFLEMDVNVEGFDLERFERYMASLDRIHFSEVSVIEAKAKIVKLSATDASYRPVMDRFGENLGVLRDDDRVKFHIYDAGADRAFNQLQYSGFRVDLFDAFILSHATGVGFLLTEDSKMIKLRGEPEFRRVPAFKDLRLSRWREVQRY